MLNLLSNFLVGFACTLFLFVLSVIIALSIKAIYLSVKEISQRQYTQTEKEQTPKTKRTRTPKKTTGVIRSVEIDPNQIDKIYVKKSS